MVLSIADRLRSTLGGIVGASGGAVDRDPEEEFEEGKFGSGGPLPCPPGERSTFVQRWVSSLLKSSNGK